MTWNLGIRRRVFERELQAWIGLTDRLEGFRLGQEADRIVWSLNSTNEFSTKSLFLRLAASSPSLRCPLPKLIWKFKVPKKVIFLLWSVAHRSLNTHERLQNRCPNLALCPSACPLCLQNEESLDHILLHCPFARQCWDRLVSIFNIQVCLPRKIDDWLLESVGGWRLRREERILWMCCFEILVMELVVGTQ